MRASGNRVAGGRRSQRGFAILMVLALLLVTGAVLAGMPKATVCRMALSEGMGLSGNIGRCL